MLRILLAYVLPLVIPTLLYFAWQYYTAYRAATRQPPPHEIWNEAPWHWLLFAGAVLVAIVFVAIALLTGSELGGEYVPPRVIDGRIVPGQVAPQNGH